MPDAEKFAFKLEINGSLVFKEAGNERVTSDAGIVMAAELLARTGLIDHLDARLTDPRDPRRIRHSMAWLL